ncbi:GTP-binding protein [Ruegeria sp. HKCCD7255]|uniref:CobW family GTP-binding protein n=1 Tax=Ruegeria sp. HKCCD7255 TaxID=2683004 RepID=UPI0014893B5A|nr:CobW family GTP-binding protein [Ruegeria sp. HKCCD7255]
MSDTGLPLTIIGGYLGAGKTTLVNTLLKNAQGQRLAVLVNEFGSLPIDADLIEAQDGDLVTLAGGCVCCSYGDDLMFALTQIRNMDPAPDHILLEASGVALPGAIASSISLFGDDIRVHGVVTLVDAETLPDLLSDTYISDTITRQLKSADLVILTKTDLAPPEKTSLSRELVGRHAPSASVLESKVDGIARILLLDDVSVDRASDLDIAPHKIPLVTKTLSMTETVDADAFAKTLASDPNVVRAKGHMVQADGNRVTLQLVGGRYSITNAPKTAQSGIVVISKSA